MIIDLNNLIFFRTATSRSMSSQKFSKKPTSNRKCRSNFSAKPPQNKLFRKLRPTFFRKTKTLNFKWFHFFALLFWSISLYFLKIWFRNSILNFGAKAVKVFFKSPECYFSDFLDPDWIKRILFERSARELLKACNFKCSTVILYTPAGHMIC